MASMLISGYCSMCQKGSGKCMCSGCKAYFCIKHFEQHRQGLLTRFDDEIVRLHDDLLDKISKVNRPIETVTKFFDDIAQWETSTVNKVHQAADGARQQLSQLLTESRNELVKDFGKITKEVRSRREELDFDENDIKYLQQKLNQMQLESDQLVRSVGPQEVIVKKTEIDWNQLIYIDTEQTRFVPVRSTLACIYSKAKWRENGITVAGGNGQNTGISQLSYPTSLYVDGEDDAIYIADRYNHRIMKWKPGASSGTVVAGGRGQGSENHQLNNPADVIIDKQRNRFIISDNGNKRIVCWSRQNSFQGEVVISNIDCAGLAIDERGFLYVADYGKHEVRRYDSNDKIGTIVAGGNGKGSRLDQLSNPSRVLVDRNHSVYVSDRDNHRVVKWEQGSKQGIVVAGGHGQGNDLAQFSFPIGFIVDQAGSIYVVDHFNHRVVRWSKACLQGHVIIGDNGNGNQSNQLSYPTGLSFDRYGNLYVADYNNHRIQKFTIETNS